jgi:hypothetical protein
MRYEIDFPLPPQALSGNGRTCWQQKARLTGEYRLECHLRIVSARARGKLPKTPLPSPVTVHLEYYMARSAFGNDGRFRGTDPDNAIMAAKPAVDALVAAGVMAGDTHQHRRVGETRLFRRKEEHRGNCMLRVVLETAEINS